MVTAAPFASGETIAPGAPRIRLRTLIFLRWLGIAGQSTAIIIVFLGLRYELPVELCAAEIGASVVFNLLLTYLYPQSRQLDETEAILHLSFDIVQLTALLMLTGGIQNPFTLLFIAPVVISATNLSLGATLGLAGFTLSCVTLISLLHWPLPWDPYTPLELPLFYLAGNWISLTLGIGFTLIYAWRTADEARGMQTALAAAQEALAREQHLSDLGALAAATAHELGTPLGTIVVVARELEREIPAGTPWLDDIKLLRSQADRCREIATRHDRGRCRGPAFAVRRLPRRNSRPSSRLRRRHQHHGEGRGRAFSSPPARGHPCLGKSDRKRRRLRRQHRHDRRHLDRERGQDHDH
jgi:two-component system sensor histidine kinase RegB